MAQSDLFAPPTKEELDNAMFAPPTREERVNALLSSGPLKPRGPDDADFFGGTPRGYLRGTLKALPPAFAMFGGAAGTMVGGPGVGLVTAGAGSAGGYALQKLGEHHLLGDPNAMGEYQRGLVPAVADGMKQELGGQIISKAGEKFVDMGVKEAANADSVRAAAARLNVKPTEGMLTDDHLVRTQEDSLGQSPSIPGALIRAEQKPVHEAMKSAGDKALADRTAQSRGDAGREIKKTLVDYIEGKSKPIGQKYDEIETHTKNIPVDETGRNRVSTNIGNIEESKFTGPSRNVTDDFVKNLEEATTVNDIKILRTRANRIAMSKQADPEARVAAKQVLEKLDRFLKNSTKRGAINLARGVQPAYDSKGQFLSAEAQEGAAQTEGQKLGRDLLGSLSSADREYAELMGDLKKIGKGSGVSKVKPGKGPKSFINDVEAVKDEKIGSKMFPLDDAAHLTHLEETSPATYEIARQQRLNELFEKSIGADGKLDPGKLAKNVKRLDPDVQIHLFGKEGFEGINDVRTLKQSMPPKTGESGTPRGFDLRDILNPMQNIRDTGRYGLLKGKKYAPKAGLMMQHYSRPTSGLIRRGLVDE